MNKNQQVIEILETLLEAILYIKNNKNSEYEFMSEISLQGICSVIEELEKSKKCIESIKNVARDIHNNILNIHLNKNLNIESICDTIMYDLRKVIEYIKVRLNHKKQIVFMPYNAFMWNSLESVWKAAVEDDSCECYVVPIPYYKLISKDNNTFDSIFNYEGDLLPDYVPIIDYRVFNLEDIRPDIIYIHNQYDECNNATRVMEQYYSYNLKKYTNMLIYIPYGISGTYPISFYLKFYSFIATRNFDKVIVQSPAFEIIGEQSGIPKERLLAMGSPKFDALINSLKEIDDKDLYDNKFKDKITLLWTTNLMKIINGRHKVLDEIEEVFKLIKNNTKYGLIYRPHPLELEYVKSQAPECIDRYISILNSVKDESNIIIDKTPNYYNAFKVSDALITDRSSVLIEYMATEKPVLIYDIGLEEELYNSKVFDIFSNYIVGKEDMSLEKFMSMLENGHDDKKYKRLESLKYTLSNRDGSCGNKIHNSIKKELISTYI